MRTITITPLKTFKITVEAEDISPNKLAPLTLCQISSLEIWQGNRKKLLSDLFKVEGEDRPEKPEETTIILKGDFSRVKRVGEGMTAGKIEAIESLGMHAGNKMSGGQLCIKGNADDWLGREMRGGIIRVSGNAGNYVGSGYRGREVRHARREDRSGRGCRNLFGRASLSR